MARFERLALGEKPVSTIDPVEEEKIVALQQHLSAFEGLDTNKLIKQNTCTVASYQKCLAKHCRQRQYIFQIRKCNDRSCCSATCVSDDSLKWLPDPMLHSSGERFLPFQEAWNRNANESDRPTLKTKSNGRDGKKSNISSATKKSVTRYLQTALLSQEQCLGLQGDSSVYTAQNACMVVNCNECQKPRVTVVVHLFATRASTDGESFYSSYNYLRVFP